MTILERFNSKRPTLMIKLLRSDYDDPTLKYNVVKHEHQNTIEWTKIKEWVEKYPELTLGQEACSTNFTVELISEKGYLRNEV